MTNAERIVLDKDEAADFGQMFLDLIVSHVDVQEAVDNLDGNELTRADMIEGYIRVWQQLKTDLAAKDIRLRDATELAQLVRERSGDEQMLALAERVLSPPTNQ